MPTYDNASGITLVVASNKKVRILSKYGSRIGYVTKWRDAASIHFSMSVEAVSYQTSLVKLFTEIRCEYFKYDEAPFQSEMLQNTTASDLPDARSTHENVPQTDDPLFFGPGLAEHADRMKIKQNNKMSSKILPRTQRMLHCLCQVRGPQKTSWAIMVAHGLRPRDSRFAMEICKMPSEGLVM